MQLFHELALLYETNGRRLVQSTYKVNLFTCHEKEYLSPILAINLKLKLKSQGPMDCILKNKM